MKLRSCDGHWRVLAHWIPALLVGGLLSACSSTGDNSISGFDRITLAPGDTGNCNSSPCQVYLKIPSGSGSYEVTANEVRVGTFSRGQDCHPRQLLAEPGIRDQGDERPQGLCLYPESALRRSFVSLCHPARRDPMSSETKVRRPEPGRLPAPGRKVDRQPAEPASRGVLEALRPGG